MVVPYLDTPRTEVDQASITQADIDFSIEPTFHSPSKGGSHDLLDQIRGNRPQPLRTPSARHALAALRQPAAKNEFTPLLKSAARNRARQHIGVQENGYATNQPKFNANGKLMTPAALKPGYKFDNSPALPEASVYDAMNSSSMGDSGVDATPVPPVVSSSTMSTPLALPRRDGEGALDGGNMLTLREQEAVSYRQRHN